MACIAELHCGLPNAEIALWLSAKLTCSLGSDNNERVYDAPFSMHPTDYPAEPRYSSTRSAIPFRCRRVVRTLERGDAHWTTAISSGH